MKMNLFKEWWGCSVFFFLLLGLSAAIPINTMAADTVKIGISEAISGAFEATGRAYVLGVQFAVDEQNAKGGLLGKKIELFVDDNEMKPDVAVRKAKKQILENKVDLLGVGAGSQNVLAATKVAEENKKIFINYGGLADSLTGKDFSRHAFRVTANSYSYAVALAKLMASRPYKRFYILCQDYAFGRDTGKAFKEQLKIYFPQAQIVGEDYHPLETKDFAPYISKVIAAKADAIFTSNWGPDGTNLVRQARSLGLKAPFPFVNTTMGNDPYVLNELKDDAIGIHVAFPHDLAVKTPENEAMIARFHAKYGKQKDFMYWWPIYNTGYTICGWQMAFAAIEKAGSLDPEKIINTFEGFSYQTPVGLWTMRKCDHQTALPMYAGVVTPGRNPWFNGSIDPKINFPWVGGEIMQFPEVIIPPTPDYNRRCP